MGDSVPSISLGANSPNTPTVSTSSILATTSPNALGDPATIPSTNAQASSLASITNAAASAAASAPAQSSSTAQPTHTGVDVGPLVGGTIGGLVLGICVGALFFLIWTRRKTRGASKSKRLATTSGYEKSTPSTISELGGNESTAATNWTVHLPQPSDDTSLRRKAKTLLQQIDLHVENFYSDVDVGPDSENAATALQYYDTDLLPLSVTALISTRSSKKAIIKHCLAHLIVSKIDCSASAAFSLLPPEIGTLPAILAQQSTNIEMQSKKVYNEAYSQWRVLTAYLRPANTPVTGGEHEAAILATADHFTNAFAPWANPSTSAASRRNNLVGIVRHAIDVGVLLFSQPSRLEFRWTNPSRRRGGSNNNNNNNNNNNPAAAAQGYPIAPALLKLTDERGKVLARPQVLVEATMATPEPK